MASSVRSMRDTVRSPVADFRGTMTPDRGPLAAARGQWAAASWGYGPRYSGYRRLVQWLSAVDTAVIAVGAGAATPDFTEGHEEVAGVALEDCTRGDGTEARGAADDGGDRVAGVAGH